MKTILQQTIIIGAVLFGANAQAAGFATTVADPRAAICSGVNGSGQSAQAERKTCGAGGNAISQPTLRGTAS
ncbi:MAG: hypothetical protein ACOY15_11670 [Pseudomonadota bacterium]